MLLEPKHLCYPLSRYPIISEFVTMVSELKPGIPWHGSHVSGLTYGQGRKLQFLFRDCRTGITIDFSEAEWDSLRKLFKEALGMAQIQPLLDSLALQYALAAALRAG